MAVNEKNIYLSGYYPDFSFSALSSCSSAKRLLKVSSSQALEGFARVGGREPPPGEGETIVASPSEGMATVTIPGIGASMGARRDAEIWGGLNSPLTA